MIQLNIKLNLKKGRYHITLTATEPAGNIAKATLVIERTKEEVKPSLPFSSFIIYAIVGAIVAVGFATFLIKRREKEELRKIAEEIEKFWKIYFKMLNINFISRY